MANDLYLTSTPQHILNATAIASSRNGRSAHLILIDQPSLKDNSYYEILKNWKDTPFSSLHIFPGRIKGLRKKFSTRKQVFHQIGHIIKDLNPDYIFTGSDRRIEFQYAMYFQKKINRKNAVGAYMDEGTFTYVGRKASLSFSDRYIDNAIKKLTYGFWWENPPTIGGSSWIKEIYAAYPDEIHYLLKGKACHSLQSCYAENPVIESFCAELVEKLEAEIDRIRELNAILTLPHESIIGNIRGYKPSIEKALGQLVDADMKVGIKYHPRDSIPSGLNNASHKNVYTIPGKLPFEAILPLLNSCVIVGDISSTLINGRWLKPDTPVLSIKNPNTPSIEAFTALFKNIGVESVEATELEGKLKQVLHV
jgi:hypothetical protein